MLGIFAAILLPVFLVAGVSAIAQQRLRLDVDSFAKAAFYVFSPAMAIDALTSSGVSGSEYGQLALGLVVTTLVLWGVGEVSARLLRLDAVTRASFLVVLLLGNTGNYALPVNLFAFGEPGVARAALVVTVNSLIWSSLGVYLAARGGTATMRDGFRHALTAPVLYAAGIGLAVNLMGLSFPDPVLKAAHILAQGLVPASLFVLGTQVVNVWRAQRKGDHTGALVVVALGRLVLAPLVAYWTAELIGLNELAQKVLTIEAAAPSAVMALVLTMEYKTNVSFAAMAILVTTLASVVTVALWLHWLM